MPPNVSTGGRDTVVRQVLLLLLLLLPPPFYGLYPGQPVLAGPPVKNWEDFVGAKFYCRHALADVNLGIQIREKMLEFSSVVLPTTSPYHPKRRLPKQKPNAVAGVITSFQLLVLASLFLLLFLTQPLLSSFLLALLPSLFKPLLTLVGQLLLKVRQFLLCTPCRPDNHHRLI